MSFWTKTIKLLKKWDFQEVFRDQKLPLEISIVCVNYRVKMQTYLCTKQRNGWLPHIPLAFFPSVLFSTPTLDFWPPLNNLTTALLFIYPSISSGQRAAGRSCLRWAMPHFLCCGTGRQAAPPEMGISTVLSPWGTLAVGTAWVPQWGSSSFHSLLCTGNKRLTVQFQLFAATAFLSGWP